MEMLTWFSEWVGSAPADARLLEPVNWARRTMTFDATTPHTARLSLRVEELPCPSSSALSPGANRVSLVDSEPVPV